jgi:hypothetical protein
MKNTFKQIITDTLAFCAKYKVVLFIAFMSMIMMCSMVAVSGQCRFWGDELIPIEGAIQDSLYGMLLFVSTTEGNGVLFDLILFFYYKIAPYGERWLLLLPEFLMALGVFSLGMCVKSLIGSRGGCFAAVIASTMLILSHNGNNLRAYSLLILFMSLTLWMYFARLKSGSVRHTIIYGVCLAGLVYSYYLAALICMMLFLADVILCYRKIIKFKCLASYLIGGVIFAPWGVFWIKHWPNGTALAWAGKPSIVQVFDIISVMLDKNNIYIFVFCYGIAVLIMQIIKQKTIELNTAFPIFMCAVMIGLFIGFMYFYSIINTTGSLWVERYFIVILPMLIIVLSYAFDKISRLLESDRNSVCISVCLILALSFYNIPNHYKAVRAYPDEIVYTLREAADWLLWQNDIYTPSVGVFHTVSLNAWRTYYVEQQGRRAPVNYITLDDSALEYEKIYTVESHILLNNAQNEFLYAHFDLTAEQNDMQIKIWTKKQI